MYMGWTNKPTKRSDSAKLRRRALDGEWRERVLTRAVSTNAFPRNAVNENTALNVAVTI